MNIQSTAFTPRSPKFNTPPQAQTPVEAASEKKNEQVDIDWSSAGRSAAIGAAFAGVPAALEVVGQTAGYPMVGGVIGIGAAAVAAALLRPGPDALLVSILTASIGVNGASQFGLAGAIAATSFVGAGMGLADMREQIRAAG